MSRLVLSFVAIIFLCCLAGCANEQQAPEVKPAQTPAEVQPEKTNGKESRVSNVVFIGQKQACDCTRKRIDNAWPVLEKVLASHDGISVKRLQLDVDDEADRYDNMKSVMVAPGIFFMDKNDKLVDMVQGEVKEEQILAALAK